MSTPYTGWEAANAARRHGRSPWRWWWVIPLALGAFGVWSLFFRDPAPAVGSQVTFTDANFVCRGLATLNDELVAAATNDQPTLHRLVDADQCWPDVKGTHAQVMEHGTATTTGGKQVSAVRLRLTSGPHADQQGWAYVPPGGL